MSFDAPLTPVGEPLPAPKKSNRMRIVLIIAGLLIVCTLVCCVGVVVFGPQLGAQAAGIMCTTEYSDLSQEQCSTWANTVFKDHPQEFLDCNNAAQAAAGSGDQLNTLFKCLDDKGIGPKSK